MCEISEEAQEMLREINGAFCSGEQIHIHLNNGKVFGCYLASSSITIGAFSGVTVELGTHSVKKIIE